MNKDKLNYQHYYFDDYNNDEFPSVQRRVEEFTNGWPIVGAVDTIMIKQKP